MTDKPMRDFITESGVDEIILKPAIWQYDDYQKAKTALTNLIAQEANKARLDELEKCAEVILWHSGGVMSKEKVEKMWYTHINNRIKVLTADKEQAE